MNQEEIRREAGRAVLQHRAELERIIKPHLTKLLNNNEAEAVATIGRTPTANLEAMVQKMLTDGSIPDLSAAEEAHLRKIAESKADEVERDRKWNLKQQKINRDIFQELCRRHRILFCEANFNELVAVPFDKYDEYITANKQKFAPAEPEDANAWDSENKQVLAEKIASYRVFKTYSCAREVQDPVARQNYVQQLVQLSLVELAAKLASVERERRMRGLPISELREQANQEAAQQNLTPFEYELKQGFIRDIEIAKMPPLPKVWLGKKLDAAFIRVADKETLRQIMRRHGAAQITARLHSIKVVDKYQFPGEQD